jgi:hypothetical protein
MRHFELRRSGNLVVRASLIVVLLVSSPTLIEQDDCSVPLPQSHGAILEQALEPDLKDKKTPGQTVLNTVESAVALFAYAHVRDQVPQQSSQPIEQSSLSVFQRCSTYRI